ncbi:MAG: hypothetical protein P8P79_07420 [Halioglobus sp.]|nr:hypothetical protein [Halioglobus sp.]
MAVSKELQAIVDATPPDFADPAADYHAVREMFAPFHGHPVGDDLRVMIKTNNRQPPLNSPPNQ